MTEAKDSFLRIQGAGPVGILAALFLRKYGWSNESIELIDPAINAPLPLHADDPRVLALSHGTLVRLAQLGIDVQATRLKRVHVSSQGHFGSMEVTADRVGVSDLGGLASYSSLLTTLRDKAAKEGLRIVASVEESARKEDPEVLVIAEGGVYKRGSPRADGPRDDGTTHPSLRAAPAAWQSNDIRLIRDYNQNAVIGWVEATPLASDTAYERFTKNGVIALLPIDGRYALVWCTQTPHAETFANAGPEMRIRLLEEVMGRRMESINSVEITGSYPLGLKWRDTLNQGNTVWIGNSAQALHPIGGQGLNLGFRDAETLAACLLQRGVTIPKRLDDYARRRKVDRWAVRTATDTLARQGWVRGAIGAVAITPGAKKMLGQLLMYGG
jgi:2-octaprenyl-6-methoxyphenol hydroxylase